MNKTQTEAKDTPKRTRAKLFDFDYILFDIGKALAIVPGLIWMRPKWRYETENAKKRIRGGAILIFNHAGFVDPIAAQFAVWYRRQHFVATKELFHTPFLRWLFGVFHCIEVDRENFSMNTFRDITEHLKGGKIVSIFPEGHINTTSDTSVTPFKSGVVMMALRSGMPVVPVYMKMPDKWYRRAVFVIGDTIDLRSKYGALPSMKVIADITADLHNKELELGRLTGTAIQK